MLIGLKLAPHAYDNVYDAVCNVCGFTREVEAHDHVYGDWEVVTEATTSADGLVVRFEAAGKSWDIPASEFTYESANNRYVATIREINPSQMKERILATLYKDGVIVSDTASYSIESYGASTAMSIPTVKTLVEAMVRYGRSAKAYNG